MTLERLSHEARQAVVDMCRRAARGRVMTDADLLEALRRCPQGAVRGALSPTDPDEESTSDRQDVGAGGPAATGGAPPRFGLELLATFHRAELVRREHHQPYVTTGHLLVALADAHAAEVDAGSPWFGLGALDCAPLVRQLESAPRGDVQVVRTRVAAAAVVRAAGWRAQPR